MKLTAIVSTTASLLASVVAAGEGVVLTKEFIDDPVPPGAEVTLRFDMLASGVVSDLTFSDDLDAALSGLVATGLPVNDVCGPGSVLSGTSSITLIGGNGRACNFDVTLMVPVGATEGDYLNTTSLATGSIDGGPVEGGPAQDTLRVEFLDRIALEKRFLDDPALPGDQVTLEFTLTNLNEGEAATAIAFADDLETTLSGLSAVGLPQSNVCGPGSQLSGDAMVTLSNGSLAAAADCTFSVMVQIPFAASKEAHLNTTSTVEASFSGSEGGGDAASDFLHVGRCTEADREDGTTMMPPASCSYVWSMKKESLTFLPTSGIEVSARVHQYDCLQPGCEVPGGTLAGTQHEFDAVVTLDIVGTGDLEGFQRTIDLVSAPAVEINSAPRTPGDPVQTFQTNLTLSAVYNGISVGDPDFLLVGFETTLAPGTTTLTDLGDGTFDVFSTFDAPYQFSLTGTGGGALMGAVEGIQDSTRLLAVVPDAIFSDGFESGDTSRWSGSAP